MEGRLLYGADRQQATDATAAAAAAAAALATTGSTAAAAAVRRLSVRSRERLARPAPAATSLSGRREVTLLGRRWVQSAVSERLLLLSAHARSPQPASQPCQVKHAASAALRLILGYKLNE